MFKKWVTPMVFHSEKKNKTIGSCPLSLPRLWDNIETLLKRNMGKPLLWESHGEMVLGEYGKGVVSLKKKTETLSYQKGNKTED